MLHRCKLCMLIQSSATKSRAVALNPTVLLILSARSISYLRFSLGLRYYRPKIFHQVCKMPSQTPTAGCHYTIEIRYHTASPKLKISPSRGLPCINIPLQKNDGLWYVKRNLFSFSKGNWQVRIYNFIKALKIFSRPDQQRYFTFPAY